MLFEHFGEHKILDSKITFIKFVIDHYNSVPHTDNDEERDNQLPFKTMSHSVLHFVAIAPSKSITLQKISYILPKSHNGLYKKLHLASPTNGKVWQPPKLMIAA